MTEAQFELMLGAFREQHNELRAIHEAALGKLRSISYALYIILGIIAGVAWQATESVGAAPKRCPDWLGAAPGHHLLGVGGRWLKPTLAA